MYIDPMLLDKRERPFNSSSHLFEPKIDGFRSILSLFGGETRIWTRHKTEVTRRFPELWNVPATCNEIVIDGEIAVEHNGNICFERTIERFSLTKKDRIHKAMSHTPVSMYVWDILYRGKSLTSLELIKRKSILESVLQPNPYFQLVPYLEGEGEALFEEICKRKWEGIVCNYITSIYHVGKRPKSVWQKVIRYETTEIAISGIRQ